MFYLHTSDNVPKTISLQSISIAMRAAGFSEDAENAILGRLEDEGLTELTFMEFLLQLPLFMSIHASIMTNPLAMRV